MHRGAFLAAASFAIGVLAACPASADKTSVAAGRAVAIGGVAPEWPAACHLPNGAGQPDVGIPRLAGLSATYMAAQLDYFATGARRSVTMTPFAAALTAAERQQAVFAFKVGTAPHTNTFGLGDSGRYRTNVWDYAGVNTLRAGRSEDLSMHPTVKPVALVAEAIKDCTKRGEIVLDPFGGSGTTLIAAEKTGRLARLIEFDPAYCDTILCRFERVTGKQATQAVSGTSVEEVAQDAKVDRPASVVRLGPIERVMNSAFDRPGLPGSAMIRDAVHELTGLSRFGGKQVITAV
jgi:cytochrome c553